MPIYISCSVSRSSANPTHLLTVPSKPCESLSYSILSCEKIQEGQCAAASTKRRAGPENRPENRPASKREVSTEDTAESDFDKVDGACGARCFGRAVATWTLAGSLKNLSAGSCVLENVMHYASEDMQ